MKKKHQKVESDASVTGIIGATPKTKEKLGRVDFMHFPLYVKFIHTTNKPAIEGTKVMVFVRGEYARKLDGNLDVGMKVKVDGTLTRSFYVGDDGVTRSGEVIWAERVFY